MDFSWLSWNGFAIAIGVAIVVELALYGVLRLVTALIARRRPVLATALGAPRRRFLVFTAALLLQAAVVFCWSHLPTRALIIHVLLIVVIFAGAWLLSGIIGILMGQALRRHPMEVGADREVRRMHTQLTVLRRIIVVVVWIIAVGIAIFTIPGAEAIGTSLLASAGLASVVAGIAAQSVLGNMFAGVQLAFSGAIRVGDVVIARDEWGRIEEITLTYIILRVWDERRIVLPSTYFTTTPFENWTRNSTELLGTVFLDVDWRISPARMRQKLDEILAATDLWDGRVGSILVTDATGGRVQVRALVSAADSGDQWALRCLVREQLVEWVVAQSADALPRERVEVSSTAEPAAEPAAED